MARGDVLTDGSESKRFLARNAIHSVDLDSPLITGELSRITNSGAVSSVVEHYLDTVGVTGSNPVSRTMFCFFGDNSCALVQGSAGKISFGITAAGNEL